MMALVALYVLVVENGSNMVPNLVVFITFTTSDYYCSFIT